jgi:hypothetical protein
VITDATYYTIPDADVQNWKDDSSVFTSVSNGDLTVNNGADSSDDFTVASDGWNWMSVNLDFPIDGDSKRIIVQQSSQPIVDGKNFTRVFTGVGDTTYAVILVTSSVNAVKYRIEAVGNTDFTAIGSADNNVGTIFTATGAGTGTGTVMQVADIGTGADAKIQSDIGTAEKSVTIEFGTTNGDVYVHEAFLLWENAGWGDQVTAEMVHVASDTVVSRYVNKIPVFGTNTDMTLMKSSDAALIPEGYGIKITAHNVSNTSWKMAMVAILHREITV